MYGCTRAVLGIQYKHLPSYVGTNIQQFLLVHVQVHRYVGKALDITRFIIWYSGLHSKPESRSDLGRSRYHMAT